MPPGEHRARPAEPRGGGVRRRVGRRRPAGARRRPLDRAARRDGRRPAPRLRQGVDDPLRRARRHRRHRVRVALRPRPADAAADRVGRAARRPVPPDGAARLLARAGDARLDGRAGHAVLRDDRDRRPRARGLPRRGVRDRARRLRRGLPLRRHRRVRPRPRAGHRHPGARRAVEPAAARRRTPHLPRAPGGGHRRGRGVAALRPRRDHGVPRQPGLPRGAVGAGRARRSASRTTRPDRCWRADEHPVPRRPPSSTATGTSARPTSWSSDGRVAAVGGVGPRGAAAPAPRSSRRRS